MLYDTTYRFIYNFVLRTGIHILSEIGFLLNMDIFFKLVLRSQKITEEAAFCLFYKLSFTIWNVLQSWRDFCFYCRFKQ